MSNDIKVYNAAKEGNFDEVKRLVKIKADINMVIMGAYDGKQKEIWQWALENGACLLWGFQQEAHQSRVFVMKYNKNISMLRGPGEVSRGTFKKE